MVYTSTLSSTLSFAVSPSTRSAEGCMFPRSTSCLGGCSIRHRARYILWGNISLTVSACRSSPAEVSHTSVLCIISNIPGTSSTSFLFHFIPPSLYLFVYSFNPFIPPPPLHSLPIFLRALSRPFSSHLPFFSRIFPRFTIRTTRPTFSSCFSRFYSLCSLYSIYFYSQFFLSFVLTCFSRV